MQVRMFVKHGQARKLANFFVCLPNYPSSNIIYPHATFYKLFAITNQYTIRLFRIRNHTY